MAEDLEAHLRGLQEEYSSLKELLETVGWTEIVQIAHEQLKLRMPGALSKTENILEVFGKEFEKGEIAGIELFISLPGIRLEALLNDISNTEEELGYDDNERTASDGGSTGDDDDTFVPAVPRV